MPALRSVAAVVTLLALASLSLPGQTQRRTALDAYVIDVEGGEATLFVGPSGDSLLVDSGWPAFDGRDADRIAAAARDAGVTEIDSLVSTHFHTDHIAGAAQLATRLPIRRFVDRGGSTVDEGAPAQALFQSYADVRRTGAHVPVRPGDSIPLGGVEVRVIAAGGEVIRTPLAGAGGTNPACAAFRPHGPEITSRVADAEDQRSLSLHLTYGRFRTAIMGDLTWNKEYDLMCPTNRLGNIDAYFVSHHGSDTSGSEALVHALRPRAALMNNGPRKGGAVRTFQILGASPGLEDVWQNHYSVPGGSEHNRPDGFIANLDEGTLTSSAPAGQAPVHMGRAAWTKLSARADGSFSITNSRTGLTKHYASRPGAAAINILALDSGR